MELLENKPARKNNEDTLKKDDLFISSERKAETIESH